MEVEGVVWGSSLISNECTTDQLAVEIRFLNIRYRHAGEGRYPATRWYCAVRIVWTRVFASVAYYSSVAC